MLKETAVGIMSPLLLLGCDVDRDSTRGPVHPDIAPYVDFLNQRHQQPVDYILALFETADVVVLCERVHPEMTQYDLIHELLQRERFQRDVGHVFTELGSSSSSAAVSDFLHAGAMADSEATEQLNTIYEDLFYDALWPNYNFYDFLQKVRRLNASLPPSLRINVYPSDVAFEWDEAVMEEYEEYVANRRRIRDRAIADAVIQRFREVQESSDPRKKALAIMNYRHAFTNFEYTNGRRGGNVAGYLMEAFPGRVVNVMLNTFAILPESNANKYAAIQEGRWDAAFQHVGNPDVGFDFENSPFGGDQFDLFPLSPQDVTYGSVFRGFVFFKPLEEHRRWVGLPGLFTDQRANLIASRLLSTGAFGDLDSALAHLKGLDTLEINSYSDAYGTRFDVAIDRWQVRVAPGGR